RREAVDFDQGLPRDGGGTRQTEGSISAGSETAELASASITTGEGTDTVETRLAFRAPVFRGVMRLSESEPSQSQTEPECRPVTRLTGSLKVPIRKRALASFVPRLCQADRHPAVQVSALLTFWFFILFYFSLGKSLELRTRSHAQPWHRRKKKKKKEELIRQKIEERRGNKVRPLSVGGSDGISAKRKSGS
ncbi:hypothetical protein CCMA1212_001873, partial [Trichoderma ghanense]